MCSATFSEVAQWQLNPDVTSQTGSFKHSNKTVSLHTSYCKAHIEKCASYSEHGTVYSHTLMVQSKLNRTQYTFQTILYKPNTTLAVSIQANKANSQPLFIFQYISAKYSAVSLCNLVTCIFLML